MQNAKTMILDLFVVAVLAGGALAENWPQWRGPFFDGSTTEKNLPAAWSTTENIAWTANLPGAGGSTPIIWDDSVFVSAMDEDLRTWAVCLNSADGSLRWKHQIGKGFTNRQGNTAASPSPITDGQNAYFLYGTGDFVAFSKTGERLWRRNITEDHGEFEILWDYAATGLLYGDRLYLPVIHGSERSKAQDKSYILCIEPNTGKELWKRPRHTDAIRESKQAYTTPYPLEHAGRTRIYITGGDHITAHEIETGKEVWRSATYNPANSRYYRTVASPVSVEGVILAAAPRGGSIFAAKPGRDSKQSQWAWTLRKNSPDVCTPLAYRGRFYILNGLGRRLICVEPHSGKVLSECRMDSGAVFQASPTGADGKIYCISMRGEAFVLSATKSLEVLHRTDMDGKDCRSSIAIANRQLFIRIDQRLYCVGKR